MTTSNQSIKAPTSYSPKGLQLTMSLPATPVLTTAQAKTALRVDFSEDDDFIDALVQGATEMAQKILNRALITQTVIAEWDAVDYETILPYAPVQSITSVKTVADSGTETALTVNEGYTFRNGVVRCNTSLGLKVTYVAGYGDASTDVPPLIVRAIERMVISMYDRRDDEVLETNVEQVAFDARAMLQPFINYRS